MSTDGELSAGKQAGYYKRYGKRVLDIIGAAFALVILSPLLAALAFTIMVAQGRPVLFKQTRVGKHGTEFTLYKFRTMQVRTGSDEGFLSSERPDVTPLGAWMRRRKLDELPQLVNVLCGHMSFVGPRPETPNWVQKSKLDWSKVEQVRPGITDLASIKYRNEEQILASVDDARQYYQHTILPDKIKIASRYVDTMSLSTDLIIVVRTLKLIGKE